MNYFNEDFTYTDELSPELLKVKAELDTELEKKLDAIEARKGLTWVQKQKASAEARQEYETALAKQLDDAGIIVRPVFEAYSRADLINHLKQAGCNYNFDKYTDAQLFRMWQKKASQVKKKFEPKHELDLDFDEEDYKQCDFCGQRLNLLDQCPICDLGDEDLIYESNNLHEWKLASQKSANTTNSPSAPQPPPIVASQSTPAQNNKYVVTIVYNGGKLRALATDGVNPAAWVAFPNHLRTQEGQKYVVDQLIWNGKNYRVSGSIVPMASSITNVANSSTQNNINENINKENYNMNFISTFDELNKLYEEVIPKADEKATEEATTEEKPVEEACTKEALTEAADDEEIEIIDDEAPIEEPVVEDEPRQLILECDKCGALVVKSEADIVADEESGLVNVEDECQFCEETKGYKIVGVMLPYEAAEEPVEDAGATAEVEEPVEELIPEEV